MCDGVGVGGGGGVRQGEGASEKPPHLGAF